MARGKNVSDFERDIMRIGRANGITDNRIAKFLGRSRQCVGQQMHWMEQDGTLGNVPFIFAQEELIEAMRRGAS